MALRCIPSAAVAPAAHPRPLGRDAATLEDSPAAQREPIADGVADANVSVSTTVGHRRVHGQSDRRLPL